MRKNNFDLPLLFSLCFFIFTLVDVANGSTIVVLNDTDERNLTMFEEEFLLYEFECGYNESLPALSELQVNVDVDITSNNPLIAGFVNETKSQPVSNMLCNCVNGTVTVYIKSGHIGMTKFLVKMLLQHNLTNNAETITKYSEIQISVLRKKTWLDLLTVFVLGPLVLINKCAFGAKIEVDVLKKLLVKPVELLLCLATQFVVMPLIGVFLGYIFRLSQTMALALFVSSACPGGGGGYVFSYLINGDITLAISASLVSTLVAMAAMPAVIGMYVAVVGIPNEVQIPYVDILLILVAIAIPISTGMFIRKKWPEFASKLVVVIKPLSWIIIAGGLVIVALTSHYILYGPVIGIAVAFLLPLMTFLVAIGLAKCFGLNWPLTKAVSLESGLKNTVLGIAVIELSFPEPQADLASILIIMITIGHTLTAIAWYFLYLIKEKLSAKEKINHYINAVESDIEETALFLKPEEQ